MSKYESYAMYIEGKKLNEQTLIDFLKKEKMGHLERVKIRAKTYEWVYM